MQKVATMCKCNTVSRVQTPDLLAEFIICVRRCQRRIVESSFTFKLTCTAVNLPFKLSPSQRRVLVICKKFHTCNIAHHSCEWCARRKKKCKKGVQTLAQSGKLLTHPEFCRTWGNGEKFAKTHRTAQHGNEFRRRLLKHRPFSSGAGRRHAQRLKDSRAVAIRGGRRCRWETESAILLPSTTFNPSTRLKVRKLDRQKYAITVMLWSNKVEVIREAQPFFAVVVVASLPLPSPRRSCLRISCCCWLVGELFFTGESDCWRSCGWQSFTMNWLRAVKFTDEWVLEKSPIASSTSGKRYETMAIDSVGWCGSSSLLMPFPGKRENIQLASVENNHKLCWRNMQIHYF